MQPEEITNYIVKELGKQHNPEDIAMALCEKTSMTWSEAQQLVRQVQVSHRQEIIARQSPILIGLSVASLLLGLGLICAGVMPLSQGVVTRFALYAPVIGVAMCI